MLQIQNLTKSYAKSEVKALDGVSLELKEGEIFGFLGPNGAGKTTAIKILTGILPYDKGTVTVSGHDIKTDSVKAKLSLGYVPDDHILFDKLSGREYIDFLANIYGVSVGDRQARADEMLEFFALKDAYDSPIKTYSHGMKQKIAIIGALIHNPKLWVLDEPLTGLDPNSAFNLKEKMKEHAKNGNTVFFSTHILEVAQNLCDRIGIINKGKIIFVGTLDELREQGNKEASLEELFLNLINN